MTIAIHLTSRLMVQALCQLLLESGYMVVTDGESPTKGSVPNILLVDIHKLTHALIRKYPDGRVLLIDTGMEKPEKLCATLLSYRIHGILSPRTELNLFKKALKAVNEGQIWIDNGSVKALLQAGYVSQEAKVKRLTGREQAIIECVCQGLSNNEIGRRLTLSPQTVKTHLYTIFKKCNVTSRLKLMTLARPNKVANSTILM